MFWHYYIRKNGVEDVVEELGKRLKYKLSTNILRGSDGVKRRLTEVGIGCKQGEAKLILSFYG